MPGTLHIAARHRAQHPIHSLFRRHAARPQHTRYKSRYHMRHAAHTTHSAYTARLLRTVHTLVNYNKSRPNQQVPYATGCTAYKLPFYAAEARVCSLVKYAHRTFSMA